MHPNYPKFARVLEKIVFFRCTLQLHDFSYVISFSMHEVFLDTYTRKIPATWQPWY